MFVLPLSRPAALVRRATVSPSYAAAVDRLFDESFDRFFGGSGNPVSTRTPAMDVVESEAGYTVTLDVPGTTREQLKVAIEGRRVTLTSAVQAQPVAAKAEGQGDTAAPEAPKSTERVLYRERSTLDFARTIVLPAEVDQVQSQARFENGVLTLTLAKQVKVGATQLAIG